MLSLRLLGDMVLTRDGTSLDLPPSKKTRALLAYLVATGRPHRRDRLCSLLWEVPDDPRGALRWSLSKLRALVDEAGLDGATRIVADRETVAFAPAGLRCDLHDLRAVVAPPVLRSAPLERLREAAEAVGGEFLEGLDLPAQSEFQGWCVAEREDARHQHVALLRALVARLGETDAFEDAAPHARTLVGREPYDAEARATLVRLLWRAGRHAEAQAQIEAGLRALRESEVPSAPLERAARELRAGAPRIWPAAVPVPDGADASPSTSVGAARGVPDGPRLIIVDDEPELRRLVAAYMGRHGFRVRTASGGGELDALLAAEPTDLVLLDVNLPGEDGFSIARRLHTAGAGAQRIMFLTAADEVVDRVAGLELGAEDYVSKPFDLRELRARVGAVLRRTAERGGGTAEPNGPAHLRVPDRPTQTEPIHHAGEGGGLPDLPPHQDIRFCSAADGVRIAYAGVGEGPPLVRPANWMTHLEYDWESPVWRHWIRELSRGHRLIRYDERGNGLSDRDAADLSFEACVSDLEAVVDAAGLDCFPIIGVSQGCAIALTYAVRHPERVSRLVLYGGYARGWAKRGSAEEIARRHGLGALIRHGWGEDNPAFRQAFTSLFVPDATHEQMRWFNDLQRETVAPETAFRLHEMFGGVEVRDLLPQVRVPTLVLHARHDGVAPFEEGRIFATEIPGARFVPLDSRNHILLEGEPAWERFLLEVRDFLTMDESRRST